MKDVQTQTTDVSLQTINQTNPDSSSKNAQKPAKPAERTKKELKVIRVRTLHPVEANHQRKSQSDRVPKGSYDEIKKFNRFQCLDKDMEADTDRAEPNTNKQNCIIKINNR